MIQCIATQEFQSTSDLFSTIGFYCIYVAYQILRIFLSQIASFVDASKIQQQTMNEPAILILIYIKCGIGRCNCVLGIVLVQTFKAIFFCKKLLGPTPTLKKRNNRCTYKSYFILVIFKHQPFSRNLSTNLIIFCINFIDNPCIQICPLGTKNSVWFSVFRRKFSSLWQEGPSVLSFVSLRNNRLSQSIVFHVCKTSEMLRRL